MFKKLALLLCLLAQPAWSSYQEAAALYLRAGNTPKSIRQFVRFLMRGGFYHGAVPFVKKWIKVGKGPLDREVDMALEELIPEVGVKQFEVLPIGALERSSSHYIHYILGKKYFRKGRYKQAIEILRRIPSEHDIYPFALLIEGSAKSILRDYKGAQLAFKECQRQYSRSADRAILKRQMVVNRDSCLIGEARVLYAQKKFPEAELKYLDLEKASFIWPEILFEEAWNSYNQRNYNRTLGKLVTYESPFLSRFFNPEVYVLRALTYLKLCLFSDAKQEVNEFYRKYQKDSLELKRYLKKHGKNYNYYYRESRVGNKGLILANDIITRLIRSAVFEMAYQDMHDSLERAREELRLLETYRRDRFNKMMIRATVRFINQQKRIIGSYIRRKLVLKYAQIYKTFEQMSNIKLEVLAQRKAQLYQVNSNTQRKRGDIKYLKRNEKQYFWTFNGEFWADELGDYVFALGSECN